MNPELKTVLTQIDKTHGKGSAFVLGERKILPIDVISSGSLCIDQALGVGGIPRGRVTEIYGPPSGGKTTLTLHIIANAQKMGLQAVFIDAENALDPIYARNLGVDVDKLIVSQPDCGEQALEIADALIKSGQVGIVVIDSVAALVPRAELEGEMGMSVSGDTPIFIRRDGILDIVPIEDLYGGSKKFFGARYVNRYKKLKKTEILTHDGWQAIKAVYLKRNAQEKPLVGVHTADGYTQTTKDHSLFIKNEATSTENLRVGDVLDTVEMPQTDEFGYVTSDAAWLLGFFCAEGSFAGSCPVFYNTRKDYIDEATARATRTFGASSVRLKQSQKESQQDCYELALITRKDIYNLFAMCYSEKNQWKKIPYVILSAPKHIKESFVGGFNRGDGLQTYENGLRLYNKSATVVAGLQHLIQSLGDKTYVSFSDRGTPGEVEFTLGTNRSGLEKWETGEIKRFADKGVLPFLYDIETESGTFVGGIGRIVHHNSTMGLQARLMSQALRKLTAATNKTGCVLIFINQIRMKIGVMFGSPETTAGGEALKFWSSVRLDVRRIKTNSEGEEKVSNTVKVKVVKNKLANPFREAEVEIIFGEGISKEADLITLGVEHGLIEKSGAWFVLDGRKFQGESNLREALKADPQIADQLDKSLRNLLFARPNES